jgi:IS5 family transposase
MSQCGKRGPGMHPSKKGNQWSFGMKCHAGVDADSGLVCGVVGTAANVNDVSLAHALVHGVDHGIFADVGYQGGGTSARRLHTSAQNCMWRWNLASGGHWTNARR